MKKTRKIFLVLLAALFIASLPAASGNMQDNTFSVTAEAATKLSKPAISSVSNTTSGVKVTWKKVSGAKGYYVYRSTSKSGTYTKIATVKSGSTVSYTNKTSGTYKVTSGKAYYYKVAAYSGSTASSKSSAKSIRYLTAGKISSVSNATSGITVKWSKVSGAKGYYVYRKSGSGSYSKIKTISSGSTVSYTDTAIKSKSGTTYTYAVRPYYGSTMGSYTGKSIKRLAGGTISSLANTSSGITVKWSKVPGASGYYVYRKTGSGSYSKIKTINSGSTVSYTDTAVKGNNGTTYTYAVRPYYSSTLGSYTGKTTVRLTTPSVTSITSPACNSMALKWGAVSSVTGYQVQYSMDDSSFSDPVTKTYSGASVSSKTIAGLYSSNTYYVKIRTYKAVSGTNYYSAWSSVKNVEISDDHSYTGTIVQDPTCTEIGWWEFTCSVCGSSYGMSIDTVPHNYQSVVTKKATCADAGLMTYTCTMCEDTYTKTIAATGNHDYKLAASKGATCAEDGYKTYACSVCEKTYTESIPATNEHDYQLADKKDASCTEDGYKVYTCSACDKSYTETIRATGHSYTNKVTEEATCAEDGVITYTCSVCGKAYTESIPATNEHDYQLADKKDASCTEDGYKVYACSVCGKTYTEAIEATGHSYISEVTEEATCAEDGVITYTCPDCGDTYEEAIPATGEHDYKLSASEDATCTEDGYETYTCPVCGDSYTNTVDATGHTSTKEWEIGTEATTDAYGTKVIRCATCGEILESENYAVEDAGSTGINVNWHSQANIIAYLAENPIDTTSAVAFDTTPSISGDLTVNSLGSVSEESQETALTALNSIRYIVGIDDNVTLNTTYSQYAQGASLINAYNGSLSHSPSQPSVMDDETYAICATGASSSNIAAGYSNITKSLLGYMSDSDSGNISMVGHRRWIINPTMGQTGFGFVKTSSGYKYYSAMYAFNKTNTSASYYGVAWPAQNMPVEYFADDDAWSISMGTTIDSSAVKVTLTRISDGTQWTFSEDSADGYFNVNNGGYGQKGCIIFRPDDITYSDGDQFAVTITGLDEEVSYQVNFFSVN